MLPSVKFHLHQHQQREEDPKNVRFKVWKFGQNGLQPDDLFNEHEASGNKCRG